MARPRRQQQPSAPPAPPTPFFSRNEKLAYAGVVLLAYAIVATWGQFDFSDLMGYYTMLADGLLQGHLYIPRAHDAGYLQDMIPFEGHLYLQWGPLPALFHLIPRLIGANLSDRVACILAGWLTALVFLELMLAIQRRYFPDLPKWILVWFFFAFAFATPAAIVALRATIYHESIAWAALFVLLAFWFFARYAADPTPRLALFCGAAIGLAVLTRVTQGIHALALFAGIVAMLRLRRQPLRKAATHLAAFATPIAFAALLVMAYNYARFRSPFEYGLHYIPSVDPSKPAYALNRVPENLGHYLLAPITFSGDVPWIHHAGWQPLVHTERAEDMSSMFLASPFLLLGFLSWKLFRSRSANLAPAKVFTAVALGSGLIVLFSLLCFVGTSRRYMQDFFPEWMIVAFAGVAACANRGVQRLRWRVPAWTIVTLAALLHVHVIFWSGSFWPPYDLNAARALAALGPLARRILPGPQLDRQEAIAHNEIGIQLMSEGRYANAIPHFERAIQLLPQLPQIAVNLRMARQLAAQSRPRPR